VLPLQRCACAYALFVLAQTLLRSSFRLVRHTA
jgi:hypothetical protein